MAKVQFSLRELLGVVLFVGLGITSLRYGGIAGILLQFALLTTVMACAVIAFAGRARLQMFAIGFAIPAILYSLIAVCSNHNQLIPGGLLPTIAIIAPAHEHLSKRIWLDSASNELPNYDPRFSSAHTAINANGQTAVHSIVRPDESTFMAIAHVLWAFVFGYFGGKLAVFVYGRRDSRPAGIASGPV